MSVLIRHRTLLSLLVGLLLLSPAGAIQAETERESVSKMVRLLGYGGAIHNFKNYVLRGEHREQYARQAQNQFNEVLVIIKRLKATKKLSRSDQKALADIASSVNSYLDGLKRIKGLFEKKWRTEDIDRVVIVDDMPAINGLNTLRAKWQWRPFEQIEFYLGYGGAIHHFKNYLLRSTDTHYAQALEAFLAIESLMAEILSQSNLSAQRQIDLAAIERVSHAYMEYLQLIERLARMQRPVRQIDLAVKINDRPALDALSRLRAQ